MLHPKKTTNIGVPPRAIGSFKFTAWPGYRSQLLDGLSWRLIGATALVAVMVALPSEPLLHNGWAAPIRFGLPFGVGSWLQASYPWICFSVIVGLSVVVIASALSSCHSFGGPAASLPIAVVSGALLGCALFAFRDVAFWHGELPWRELSVELLTWSFVALTWYALEHTHLLTQKGLAVLVVFAFVDSVRAQGSANVISLVADTLVTTARALPLLLCVIAVVERFPDPGRQQYCALMLAVSVGAVIGTAFDQWIAHGLIQYNHPPFVHFGKSVQSSFLRLSIPGALFAAVYAYQQNETDATAALERVKVDQARLAAQMDEARLQVLRAQIEPHFLFNTLAHLKRLYQTDAAAAGVMLDNLMRYLTAALPQLRVADSTVGRETDLAKAYLDIYRIRMGHRLAVEMRVPDLLRDAHFPPMMLLTLVENAVKHGLNPLAEGGFIRIEATASGGCLDLTVADTGCGFVGTSGAGTGLANIRARLTAFYGEAGRLSLFPNSPRGMTASIAVPLVMLQTQVGVQ
jgi:signal transduction histidine kinase